MRTSRFFVMMFASLAALLSLPDVSVAQMKVLYNFNGTLGANPGFAPIQGRDGELYGTASLGGTYGLGSIFKITTTGQFTILHSFNGTDGKYPLAGLTLGAEGNFYGVTEEGGTGSWGVLFKLNPAGGRVTILHNFNQDGVGGFLPLSPPILGSDGNFYGATTYGGITGDGAVYKLTPAGLYTIIYNYDYADGYAAEYTPTQGNDGSLYVVALYGGSNQCGSVIKISTAGEPDDTYSFECGANGGNPVGSLLQASDGNFYGVANNGGSYSEGVLFKVNTSFDYTVLHSFGATTTDGTEPDGGLIQATDGNLYGVTSRGGSFNDGAIYNYSLGGGSNTLFSWNREIDAGGSFLQHTNGTLYGVTYVGGTKNLGTVYNFSHGLRPFVTFVQPTGRTGQTAQILGQGLTGTTAVTFNGIAATKFTVVSDTFMTAVVPSGAVTGPVVVTTPGGTLSSNVSFRITN